MMYLRDVAISYVPLCMYTSCCHTTDTGFYTGFRARTFQYTSFVIHLLIGFMWIVKHVNPAKALEGL